MPANTVQDLEAQANSLKSSITVAATMDEDWICRDGTDLTLTERMSSLSKEIDDRKAQEEAAAVEALRQDNRHKKISKAEFRALPPDDQRFSPGKKSRIAAKFDRQDASKQRSRARKKERSKEKMRQAHRKRTEAVVEDEGGQVTDEE